MNLDSFFQAHPKIALGFSGGVDSACLLGIAKELARVVRAYFVQTGLQPSDDLEDARDTCSALGIPLRVLNINLLEDPDIVRNGKDRCYHCKKAIFSAIADAAAEDGIPTVVDGTNASDDASDRPGMRAIKELGVLSPLRDAGLTKEDVRFLAKEKGIGTWNKPPGACLATRIPDGTPLTEELLRRTERTETALRAVGLRDFRVRTRNGLALLQVKEEEFPYVLAKRKVILEVLKASYGAAALDLEPRQSKLTNLWMSIALFVPSSEYRISLDVPEELHQTVLQKWRMDL